MFETDAEGVLLTNGERIRHMQAGEKSPLKTVWFSTPDGSLEGKVRKLRDVEQTELKAWLDSNRASYTTDGWVKAVTDSFLDTIKTVQSSAKDGPQVAAQAFEPTPRVEPTPTASAPPYVPPRGQWVQRVPLPHGATKVVGVLTDDQIHDLVNRGVMHDGWCLVPVSFSRVYVYHKRKYQGAYIRESW